MADPQAMPISAKKREVEPRTPRAATPSAPGAEEGLKADSANVGGGRNPCGSREESDLPKALGDRKGVDEAAAAVGDEDGRRAKKARTSENAGDSENAPPLPSGGSGSLSTRKASVALMRRVRLRRKHMRR